MRSPATILMFGRDAQLLATRRMVLEMAGYCVLPAASLADFDRLASSNHFDLLILCHTLSREDCGRAVASKLSRRPSARGLTLTAGARGCATLLDQALDVLDGPAKLVSTVSQLLEAEGTFSSHAL